MLVFDGDPLADITLLGQRDRFRQIFKNGQAVDLSAPIAEHWDLPGWRVSEFSSQILTRELVDSMRGKTL